MESAGRRPEDAISVGIWDTAFATVLNDRTLVAEDPSLDKPEYWAGTVSGRGTKQRQTEF